MSWNPNMDPVQAMMQGYHPLDVATGGDLNRSSSSPLNPENPNSPLKNRLKYPTPEEMYSTASGDAKGKKALDHPYFTQKRLLERALDKEHLNNPNISDAEKLRMRQLANEYGVAPWQDSFQRNN